MPSSIFRRGRVPPAVGVEHRQGMGWNGHRFVANLLEPVSIDAPDIKSGLPGFCRIVYEKWSAG